MDEMKQQELLNQFIATRLQLTDTINAMMDFHLMDVDFKNSVVTLGFPIKQWQINPMGVMHGGMICTAIDITMGCAAYMVSHGALTPTIEMSVNFVRPAMIDDELVICARVDHGGKRFVQLRAEVKSLKSNQVVASAVGTYCVND